MKANTSTHPATTFTTTDLSVASYLVALGHPLLRIDGPRGRRVFVFEREAETDSFTYFQDTHPVSARKLFGAYRDLKKALFEQPE
jgi:hypothetical protein